MERSRCQGAPLRGAVSRPKRLHREVERKRRMRVSEQVALLRRALCDSHAEKSDTVSVLQRAVHFVNVAQTTIANLHAENDALRRDRARVVGDWAGAAAVSAAAVPDALQRDVVASSSASVMQSARDCYIPPASRTVAPWPHPQNGVSYPSADRTAHFAPAPPSPHASLPHFDMLRQYPQQHSQHPQHKSFAPSRSHTHIPYNASPQLVTHATHMPVSTAQCSAPSLEPPQSQPAQHSPSPLSCAQPHHAATTQLNVSPKPYEPKPMASAPRDLSNS
eukprot:TRINITY_DN47829_c0_g1_i1.p1 TRINITY_DN47829_c0_g1~~TRINITY_DN47829_c0_g1_i1.p1  ORF type:complete len:277 (+),score=51.55 TRINITY_DN47829_c0_g1_i1:305-1135(+)